MDLNFSLDLDSQEIHIIVDNTIAVTIRKDDDRCRYKNFDRLDDELQDALKRVCNVLFTLEV